MLLNISSSPDIKKIRRQTSEFILCKQYIYNVKVLMTFTRVMLSSDGIINTWMNELTIRVSCCVFGFIIEWMDRQSIITTTGPISYYCLVIIFNERRCILRSAS